MAYKSNLCSASMPSSQSDTIETSQIPHLANISEWLRKETELSFYGDIDSIPAEEYAEEDARKAYTLTVGHNRFYG